MGRKPLRWIALFDSHGDQAHFPALRKALEFAKDYGATIRIAGGDHFNLDALRTGASREERAVSLDDDIQAGCDFLSEFKPTHYLWGNHERRINEYQQSMDAVERQFARDLTGAITKAVPKDCRVYRYSVHKPMRFKNYLVVHGFSCGIHAVRTTIAHYHENIMCGHVHSFTHSVMGTRHGFSSACLCRMDMPYADRRLRTLEWSHGFLYGTIEDKRVWVNNARIKGDKVMTGLPWEVRDAA